MARTRKANVLARGRRIAGGIPGRDTPPPFVSPEWQEYYRRANLRSEHHSSVRCEAGWTDAPSYIYPNHNRERL